MPEALVGRPLGEETQAKLYHYAEQTPVFFGHYWMEGTPTLCAPNAICTDWSIGIEDDARGTLAAYRWTEGEPICDEGFKFVRKVDVLSP